MSSSDDWYARALRHVHTLVDGASSPSSASPLSSLVVSHSSRPVGQDQSRLSPPLLTLCAQDVNLSYDGFLSLLRNVQSQSVRRSAGRLKSLSSLHLREYTEGASTLLELSVRENFPPFLLAKNVVEAFLSQQGLPLSAVKKRSTDVMKDPVRSMLRHFGNNGCIVSDAGMLRRSERRGAAVEPRLDPFSNRKVGDEDGEARGFAADVMECIVADPIYGSRHDKYRRSVGIEVSSVVERNSGK